MGVCAATARALGEFDRLGVHYSHDRSNFLVERYKKRAAKWCFERARHIVVWSQWVSDSLARDYGLDPATREWTGSFPVVEPWEGPTEWQDPHPSIEVADGTAYVTEPATRQVHAGAGPRFVESRSSWI